MNCSSFVPIPLPLYRELTPAGDERTDFYRHSNPLVRRVFWSRLHAITRQIEASCVRGTVLDFGGGSGVMLPTLERFFRSVTCVDLDIDPAVRISSSLGLHRVELRRANALARLSGTFDAVVAADVLEHFEDVESAVAAIRAHLRPGGWLFTSLPTEGTAYALIRRLVGKTKPLDHYHDAYQVEDLIRRSGFTSIDLEVLPARAVCPLWHVSTFRAG